MGNGESHPARLACESTGCLVHGHSDKDGKHGPGGAKLALHPGADNKLLYVLGNKGLAVFDTANLTVDGHLPRVGSVISTGCVAHDSGCDMVFHPNFAAGDAKAGVMYVVGGKGLGVFDIASNPQNPKLVDGTSVIDTGVLKHCGGAACVLVSDTSTEEGHYLYVAGSGGLAVFKVPTNAPEAPEKVGETYDTGALSHMGGAALHYLESEKLLYVAGGKGLAVYDVKDPAAPVRLNDVLNTGCVAFSGCPALAGVFPGAAEGEGGEDGFRRVLFIAGGKKLGVLDLTNPREPKLVQTLTTGVMAPEGGSAMVVDMSDQLYGKTNTLLIAGGKALGVFTLPPVQELIMGSATGAIAPERQGRIHTGATSHDNDSAILLDNETRLLYVAGGNGLAAFDLAKFDGATLDAVPAEDDVEEPESSAAPGSE